MKRTTRHLVLAAALAGGAGLWYLFRPDALILDRTVSEEAPAGGAVILTGRFEPRSHEGRGSATVVRLADGRRVLRFDAFRTLNGPDLQVYLLADPAAERRGDLSRGFLSLGALKGNEGPQNYDIPAGTDLSRYRAVAVWCRRFGVNFTTAALAPAPEAVPAEVSVSSTKR